MHECICMRACVCAPNCICTQKKAYTGRGSGPLRCTCLQACTHTSIQAGTHTPLMRCIDWMILSRVSQPTDTTCPLLESRRLTTNRLTRRVRGVHGEKEKMKRNHLKKKEKTFRGGGRTSPSVRHKTLFKKRLPGNIKGYFDSGQMSFFLFPPLSPASFPCCRSSGILFRQR